jgi:S-adenosylmethionine/arginine decarboxylase-like enzyme
VKIHGQELWAYIALDGRVLADVPRILAALRTGAGALGCSVLSEHHQLFEPEGTTAIVVIGESHLLASTYAELGILAVNIQTCSASMELLDGLAAICATLHASEVRSLVVMRRLDVPMRIALQAEAVPVRGGRLLLDAAVYRSTFSASSAIR